MKILIATDSFKGSNSALKVAGYIEAGILKAVPDAVIKKLPIADGGEGTMDALIAAMGGRLETARVCGPLGETVEASYGILNDGTAVIEVASASGLTLVPHSLRNPLAASSFGTGQLIRTVLEKGYRDIIIGLGGSATNDGGAGLLQALGISLRDAAGNELGCGGGELSRLATIDTSGQHPLLSEARITAICDVLSPLCGPSGASVVFGPQKGATPEMVKQLDANLMQFATVIKKDLKADILSLPSGGAAGGIGAALNAFCGAQLRSGIDTVLEAVEFRRQLEGVDLVITGEGRIDAQSAQGKVPYGVATQVKQYDPRIGVAALVGDIGAGAEKLYDCGIDSIMSTVNKAMPLDEAIKHSGELLEDAAERMIRFVLIGQGLPNDKSHT